MKQTGISRRDLLKLMSLGLNGLALNSLLPARAQETVYAEDVALSAAEILRARAANLRFAFNLDQTSSDYSQVIVYAARRASTEYGITLDVNSAAGNASIQAAAMSSQVKLAYDGIFTLAVDTLALADALEQANQASIPVMMNGGQPPRGQLLAQINSTNDLGCYQAAAALIQSVGSAGKIAVLSSGRDLSIYRNAERGALQAISESGMQLVDLAATVDEADAHQVSAALLQSHPDLSAIFCTWVEAVNGTLVAISEAGSSVQLGGFGADGDAFSAFAASSPTLVSVSGERASVIGRSAINALCKGFLGSPVAAELVVPTVLVNPSNYQQRWNEMYPNLRAPWEGQKPTATPATP